MSLWAAYVVLVDWGRLLDWTRGHDSTAVVRQTTARDQALWASVLASAVILPMAIVQGARGKTEAWPFACYPTFQWVVGDRLPDVEMTFVDEHGTEGAPHRLPTWAFERGVVTRVARSRCVLRSGDGCRTTGLRDAGRPRREGSPLPSPAHSFLQD